MDSIFLNKYINNPQLLKSESVLADLSDSMVDYPYSQPLRILYLMSLKVNDAPTFIDELKKSALFIADRKLLYYLLEASSEVQKNAPKADTSAVLASPKTEVKEEPVDDASVSESDKTIDLIDSFLATLPEDETYNKGLELASDYTTYLLEEGDSHTESKLDEHDLIDAFIRTQSNRGDKNLKHLEKDKKDIEPSQVVAEEKVDEGRSPLKQETEAEDEGFFTETLSRIYVKQQRYDKALEILKKLSLKYPNKNAYFADQIRFLEKLIINDKSK